jgi:EmrB/QacA subfamily drug resistance transporter
MKSIAPRSPILLPCIVIDASDGLKSSCASRDRRSILILTVLGSSIAFMDESIVNVALPTLQATFRASSSEILWVVQSYALFCAALLLFCGALGDRFGRKRTYLAGITIFAVASMGCAAAVTLPQLIVARAVQGVGAALLIPQGLAILSSAYSEMERPSAIGIWSAWTAVFAAFGPILGGWLIQIANWRAIFLINLPFTVWIFMLSPKLKEERADQQRSVSPPLDYLGATLNTFGFGAVVYALSFVPRLGWRNPAIVGSFLIGVVLLAAFFWSQKVRSNALIPLSLFRNPRFAGANLLTFLSYGSLGAAFYAVPFFLIGVRHFSPSAAGAAFLPIIVLMFAFSGQIGKAAAKFGELPFMVLGSALSAAGFALLALLARRNGYLGAFFPGVLTLGAGMTLAVAPLTNSVMSSVATSKRGIASAVNNSVSRLAALLFVSVAAPLLSHIFSADLRRELRSSGLPSTVQQQLISQRSLMLAMHIPEKLGAKQGAHIEEMVQTSFVAGYRGVMLGCSLCTLLGTLTILIASGKNSRREVNLLDEPEQTAS